MKKFIIIICALLLVLTVTGCGSKRKLKVIGNKINISLESCELEEFKDTHGGFLGDGDTYAKITCDDETNKKLEAWVKFPINEIVKNSLDMKQCGNSGCFTVFKKYNIPEIENGRYYYFNKKPDPTILNDEYPTMTNYYIGIFDVDNKVLYFYEYDS